MISDTCYLIPNIWCSTSDNWFLTHDIWYSIYDNLYLMIYIRQIFFFLSKNQFQKSFSDQKLLFLQKNFQHAHRAIGKWYWFLTKSFCSARITIWETPPLSLCVCNKASRDSYVGRTVRWLVCQFGHKFQKSLETLVGQLYRLWKGVSTQAAHKTTVTVQYSVQYLCAHSCPRTGSLA